MTQNNGATNFRAYLLQRVDTKQSENLQKLAREVGQNRDETQSRFS